VTFTLTLDQVILHTVVHHSLTSTSYMPELIEIEETLFGRTDIRMYVRTHGRTFKTSFVRSTLLKNRPENEQKFYFKILLT